MVEKNGVKRIRLPVQDYVSGKGGWIQPLTERELEARQKEHFRKSGLDLLALIKDKIGDDIDVSIYHDIFSQNTTTENKKKRRNSSGEKQQSATKQPKKFTQDFSMESQEYYNANSDDE